MRPAIGLLKPKSFFFSSLQTGHPPPIQSHVIKTFLNLNIRLLFSFSLMQPPLAWVQDICLGLGATVWRRDSGAEACLFGIGTVPAWTGHFSALKCGISPTPFRSSYGRQAAGSCTRSPAGRFMRRQLGGSQGRFCPRGTWVWRSQTSLWEKPSEGCGAPTARI